MMELVPTKRRPATRHRRRGFSMTELTVAVAIAVSAMVGITQLMSLALRQFRVLDQQTVARQELGNVMDDLMTRPWGEITPKEKVEVVLSETCRQVLPEATLAVQVVPEDPPQDVRRIMIELHWGAEHDGMSRSARLVAWRYRRQEVAP